MGMPGTRLAHTATVVTASRKQGAP